LILNIVILFIVCRNLLEEMEADQALEDRINEEDVEVFIKYFV